MKSRHRKTAWLHGAFSLAICAILLGVVLVRRDISTVILALAFALYISGNSLIHVRRGDYSREVLYEYLLLGTAVFVVLFGALRSV